MRRTVAVLVGLVSVAVLAAPGKRAPAKPGAMQVQTPPGASSVEPSPAQRAAEAKARGDAALVAGRQAEALAEYEAALALVPEPALLYNKGRALQGLERFPEAVRALESFARTAPPELRARVPKLDALLVEVRAKASAVEVTCPLAGAEVRIGNVVVGTTPLGRRIDWNAGDVVLSVVHPDFHPFQRAVTLPGAGVAVIEVQLSPKATTGLLRVSSPVPGAALRIDDVPRGTSPFEGYLPLGTHRVELTADGFEPVSSQVVITSTGARDLAVDLAPTPKLYQRWYFWVAVIGAVAAGTATAVAFTTERPPVEGSLGITSVGQGN